MSVFFFGKNQHSKKKTSVFKKRSLNLESLETRELLSVAPLTLPNHTEIPTGMAVDWFESLERKNSDSAQVATPFTSSELSESSLTDSGDAIPNQDAILNQDAIPNQIVNQWIVQLNQKILQTVTSVASVAEQLAPYGITVLSGLGSPGLLLTQVETPEQSELLTDSDWFDFRQPNYVITTSGVAQEVNDPDIGKQWALDSINVDAAWNVSNGSGVVVAVLDSGTTLTHPDLRDNIWINTLETVGDGIDNDGNGFIDDINGWNFVSGNANVSDTDGHGTHVTGIIGAVADNTLGGVGAAPGVQILPVKVISGSTGSTANIVSAINYVIGLKSYGVNVSVINMSLGYYSEDIAVGAAIEAAGNAGIVVAASAGNNSSNNDTKAHYPSGYNHLDNLIAVASLDQNGQLASNSNYGRTTVDLAAPGVSIYSTTKNGSYGLMSGTSMAAPFVSAAAAILAASDSTLSPAEIKTQIMNSAEPLPNLAGKVVSGGQLNFANLFVADKPSLPEPPTNLSILTVAGDNVTLQWRDNSRNETKFELQYSTDNGNTWTVTDNNPAANQTQISVSITAGIVHQFRIRAVNELGNSDWSEIVTMPPAKPVKPATPTGFKSTVSGSQQIIVSWKAVSNATAYRVERSLSSSGGWNEVYSGNDLSFTDTGLNSSTKYYYRVYALNYYVLSGASSVVSPTTHAEIPATPSNIHASILSTASVRISWDTAIHATNYRVEFFDSVKNRWSVVGTTTSNSYQHNNLKSSTTYQYRVIALSKAGESLPSNTATISTPIALPKSPTGLKGTILDSSTIDLSWKAVDGASSYRLEYSLTGRSNDWKKLSSSVITGTSGKAVNLAAGMKHYFRVVALNEAGESKASNVLTITTPALAPVSSPNGLTAQSINDTKIQLFWNAVENATQYLVERSTDGNVWKKTSTVSAVSTEVTVSGHKATTTYYYRVTATSKAGTSLPSQEVTVTTRIKTPSAPRITVLSNDSVKIAWNLAAGVSGYRIERSLEDSILWESVTQSDVPETVKEWIDTNCDPNTVYQYRIIALGTDAAVHSEASKAKSVTTAPATPTGLSVTEALDRQITLTWDMVEGAKSYLVEKFNGTRWVSTGNSKTTELTVKSLKAESMYEFRVVAVGKTGKSIAGTPITVTTAIAIPPTPSKLKASAIDSESIALTWKAAVGATEYHLLRYDTVQKIWEQIGTTSGLSYIDNGLDVSVRYSYQVFASNSTGRSRTAAKTNTTTLLASNSADAPDTLLLDSATTKTLKLSFTGTLSGRLSYRIQWSLDGILWDAQKKFTIANNSAKNIVSLTGLLPETSYYVRIRLETGSQVSSWSSVAVFSTT
ncbi:MAG: S8 family serine peptidase [Planctomycetaceae bacterium]|jgi:subtilisin family serine protease/fibronectin type 3 domain-containing protein|nr:S8 family serine peptidase [Planctomycetaceae bacterium]